MGPPFQSDREVCLAGTLQVFCCLAVCHWRGGDKVQDGSSRVGALSCAAPICSWHS